VTPGQVTKLEAAIDSCTADLKPLQSFILPGGRPAAAWLHAARVVCRRTELQVAALFETEIAHPAVSERSCI
jgi:cob(I)alamin adenosyltransferase